ncbi:hypothetical protein [Microbispora sp. NPDC046933]|uniref:hypothetical protein n=1 Tax=Microbispora sp. NPDC046933 TaxID=3155618 RepID=UPI0033CBF213
MSTPSPGTVSRRASVLTRVGLVLAGVLAIGDIVTSIPQFADDPVVPLAVVVLGLLSLAATPFAWAGATWARNVVIVARVLAALTAVPAFFLPGLPAGWVVAAASGIVLSLVVAVLLLAGTRAVR